MILNMANMIVAKYVTIMEYFTTFSSSQGSKIAQNGGKTVHHFTNGYKAYTFG